MRRIRELLWCRSASHAPALLVWILPMLLSSIDPAMAFSSSTSSSSSTLPSMAVSELVSGDAPWNSLVGEADRAFKYAITLEKNGRARSAAGAFHEAATLYQCFLDSPSEFGHVTAFRHDGSSDEKDGSNGDNAARQILAYAALSLGFLNRDVLQSPHAAARLYERACQIDPVPTAVGYDGLGQSLEAAGAPLQEAVAAYRQALELQSDSRKAQFHLAVALDRLHQQQQQQSSSDKKDDGDSDAYARESNQLLEGLRRQEAEHACWVDSWGYVRWHTRRQPPHLMNRRLYAGTRDMLEIALEAAQPLIEEGGLVCEFGVGSGRSLRMTQEILPLDQPINGFDTFTGLPQAWGLKPAGAYSTGGVLPVLEGNNVRFYKGLFRDTIAPFLEQQQQTGGPDAFLAYAAIDCRLYSSTLDILEAIYDTVVPGTILIFSEYIGHPTWRQDEFRAWRECCKRFGWKYEYLAFSLSTKQAVVRVTSA